jgi:hypothetical protein
MIAPAGEQPTFPDTVKEQQARVDASQPPVPSRRSATPAVPSSRMDGMHVPVEHLSSRTSGEAQPRLVIGRIDVVVVSKEQQPSTRSVPVARTETGFVSRNYLKRL